jgi:D-alanyl-D-alanine carboxypeptidase
MPQQNTELCRDPGGWSPPEVRRCAGHDGSVRALQPRFVVAALLAVALLAVSRAAAGVEAVSSATPFRGSIASIPAALAQRMTGVSWRPGCPVPLRDLRLVMARHWGFDGRPRTGRLVVHRDVATRMLGVLRRLYVDRFPIRRMWLVDAYQADDFRSIEADNTSAFNCRFVDGTKRWSEHAYGRAIDVNPIENPYVSSAGTTSHPASVRFLRRSPYRQGMAVEGEALVRAFDRAGFGWGGRWSGATDYHHSSAGGR